MRGTKDIKDFNFQAAGKCAFALASHYHKEGNLKKTFECYKKGSELGHFKCTLEAGYLCLHYHAELGLLNGLKTAEHYFNDAHMLKPDKAESPAVTSMTSATPFPKPTEDIIANFLISHDDVEKHQDANLQQYIKWKLQAFASGHRDAIIDLRDLFQEPGQKFTGDIPLTIRPSSLLDKNESSIFADPIIKPFNITICNPELAQLIHTIYSDDNCSPEAIVDLAKRCYEALGLTVIEDERLVELANQTYVTTSKLQIEKISKR
jgi:hypothetical protein